MQKWYEDGKLLRKTRKGLGITQEELAKRAGVSQNLISAIEEGRRNFVQPSRSRIWHALGEMYIELEELKLSKEETQELRDKLRMTLAKLERSASLDDPVVRDIIESLRREIATLEQRVEQARLTSLAALKDYVKVKE